jgi:hypothetical protein
MNDFLNRLRNGKMEKQSISRSLKTNKDNFHRKTRRFNSNNGNQSDGNQKPRLQSHSRDQIPIDKVSSSLLQEAVENLCSSIDTLTKTQEHLIKANEKTVDMMERQVVILGKKLDHMNIYQKLPTPVKTATQKNNKIVKKDFKVKDVSKVKLLGRNGIMDIIQEMRQEGSPYGKIAKRLIDLGQPTFSGRGAWHSRTIYNLCNKQ